MKYAAYVYRAIEEVPRLITPTLQSSDRKSALELLPTTGRFPPLLTEERNWSPLIANMTTEQAATLKRMAQARRAVISRGVRLLCGPSAGWT